jgi:alkylation response protein AidB-like acyl-CoA dehydrogenase
MGTYRAPVRDMRFWLGLHLEAGATSDGADVYAGLGADVVDAVLDEAARLGADVLDPLYRRGDEHGAELVDGQVHVLAEFRSAYRAIADGGWVGLAATPEFGGQGLPQLVSVAVNEIWKASNLALALCPMLTQGAIEALHRHGSESLQRRFLPKLIGGDWTGTMNLTEPQAGSDLGALRTTAVPEGDHYRLKGRKIFITWGDHDLADNVIHLVLARTPHAPPGVHGISMFVVPKFLVNDDGSLGERNEVATVSLEGKLGIHASPTCVLSYGDDRGAVGYLVGEENRGLSYMFTMMNSARLSVGIEGLALSERAYQQSLAYALERVQGSPVPGAPADVIFEHPDVRRMLMLMKSGTEAMRGLAYAAAAEIDRAAGAGGAAAAERVALLTPVIKGWCTEFAQELTSLGLQVHGGVGYVEETGAAQILRDARITTIYEGTTGIQANDLVGRKLLRDEGKTLNGLLDELDGLMPALADCGDTLAAIRAALGDGIVSLRMAATCLLERHADDASFAGGAAVNFLMALGMLLGGWQLARGGLVACERLTRGGDDGADLEARVATAEFYAEHVMPRIGACTASVIAGSRSIMRLRAEQFAR